MSFYADLKACDNTSASVDCADDERAVVLAKLINAAYGGPIYPVFTCPAGPEPLHPMAVLGTAPTELALNEQEMGALTTFASERYEGAHSAWLQRIKYCKDGDNGDNGNGYGPPPVMPGGSSMDTDTIVFMVALIGVGMVIASRVKRNK